MDDTISGQLSIISENDLFREGQSPELVWTTHECPTHAAAHKVVETHSLAIERIFTKFSKVY